MDTKRTEFLILSVWKLRLLLGVVVVAVSLTGWSLYQLNRMQATHAVDAEGATAAQLVALRAEQSKLLERISALEAGNADLERQLALAERSRQIDAEAYAVFNQEQSGLQDQLSGLQEELAFYRGIMSPDQTKVGIEAQDFLIEPAGGTARYRFSFMLTQASANAQLAKGTVRFSIEGVLDGKSKRLNLSELTQNKDSELSYRFRYFQAIKGELLLPEGFDPERVVLKAVPASAPKLPLEWIFDWPSEVADPAARTQEK